jgi:hypothetical protein
MCIASFEGIADEFHESVLSKAAAEARDVACLEFAREREALPNELKFVDLFDGMFHNFYAYGLKDEVLDVAFEMHAASLGIPKFEVEGL